jgi:hypothetical protein
MENVSMFLAIWYILLPCDIYHNHLVYFVVIGYIFPILSRKKFRVATLPKVHENKKPETIFPFVD